MNDIMMCLFFVVHAVIDVASFLFFLETDQTSCPGCGDSVVST